MTTTVNDWELSVEDMRLVATALNAVIQALRAGGATSAANSDEPPNVLDDYLFLHESFVQHLAVARGEHEIIAELARIENPPSERPDEIADLRSLEQLTPDVWERLVEHREDRQLRLSALLPPESVVLLNDLALVYKARAGLAWQMYRHTRARIDALGEQS